MKTILAVLLATVVLTTAARADVFVYRGLYKISADLVTGATFGKVTNLYLVVDYDNAQYASILFSNHLVGGKHFARSSVTGANVSSAPLPKSHTATFFTNGNLINTNPTNFANSALLFRGTDKTLLIRKTPVSTPANRPNVLTGAGVSGAGNPTGSSFVELHIGATFQGATTIKANNASQSIDEALDDLVAGLTAKGFTSS